MLSPVLANLCKSNQYFRDSGAYSGAYSGAWQCRTPATAFHPKPCIAPVSRAAGLVASKRMASTVAVQVVRSVITSPCQRAERGTERNKYQEAFLSSDTIIPNWPNPGA